MRKGLFTYRSNIALGKGFTKPWTKVESFLDKVSTKKIPSRVAVELTHLANLPSQCFLAQKEYLDLQHQLYGYSNIGAWTLHQWVISNSELSNTISHFEQLRPLPKQELPPVVINITLDFELLTPKGELLKHQSPADYGNFVSMDRKEEILGQTRARIYLSENSKMELFLCVPFENMCPELVSQVQFLRDSA